LRWVLTHTCQICNVGLPRIIKGDQSYTPEGWPENYVDNRNLSFNEILNDLEKGRNELMAKLKDLSQTELDAEIQMRRGSRKRGNALMLYLSEILWHSGQIAYIKGAINRRRETDEHFLV
jgi:hypothetical protein